MTDPGARRSDFDALPASVWSAVRGGPFAGRTLFLTGATGFAGSWLLAAIARLNERLAAPLAVRALARAPQRAAAPWLAWVHGDVRDFTDDAPADFVLHAGLPSTATPPGGDAVLRETAVRGMERVVAHASACGARRLVVLSSGAVYGAATMPLPESAPLQPLDPGDTYALAKRDVEAIATAAPIDLAIARLFTCLGPGYRAHGHLAHVALIDAARAGRPLVLRGDGRAVRSYLYGADLAVWLLMLLAATGRDVVNVGSDTAMTLEDFARRVARVARMPLDSVQLGTEPDTRRPCFVPDISRARERYRLAPWTTVDLAIGRTLAAGTLA